MRKRIICFVLTVICIVLSVSSVGFSKPRWVQKGDKWKLELHEGGGDYVADGWKSLFENGIDEKVYYFDWYGNMVTGSIVINGKLYVYADTGEAVTTGFDINGAHYDTDPKGMVIGLPQFYDLSAYPVAVTSANYTKVTIDTASNATLYEDNNIVPTAAKD